MGECHVRYIHEFTLLLTCYPPFNPQKKEGSLWQTLFSMNEYCPVFLILIVTHHFTTGY
jgi:hypothetical protein